MEAKRPRIFLWDDAQNLPGCLVSNELLGLWFVLRVGLDHVLRHHAFCFTTGSQSRPIKAGQVTVCKAMGVWGIVPEHIGAIMNP